MSEYQSIEILEATYGGELIAALLEEFEGKTLCVYDCFYYRYCGKYESELAFVQDFFLDFYACQDKAVPFSIDYEEERSKMFPREYFSIAVRGIMHIFQVREY